MDGCQNAIVGRPHIVVRAPRIFRRNLMSVHTILIYCWHKANYCILTTGNIILIRINKISIQFGSRDNHMDIFNIFLTFWEIILMRVNMISPRIKTIVLTPKNIDNIMTTVNTMPILVWCVLYCK